MGAGERCRYMERANRVDLRQLFMKRQAELPARLSTNREVITHPGTLGDTSEVDWRGMLASSLPARYCVDKAFVVDADGERSNQLDLVIYDRQYSPLLFNRSGTLFIPAESVYAVLEVKQDLDRGNVEYAGHKVASVRRLRRTSAPITHAGGRFEARLPFDILGGIVCLESTWDPPLGRPLASALESAQPAGRLDLGCILHHGAFEVTYGPGGRAELDRSEPETALIFFFFRLVQRLQQLGTVTAIDLAEYGRVLEA